MQDVSDRLELAVAREAKANLQSTLEPSHTSRSELDFEVERVQLDLKTPEKGLAVTGETLEQAMKSTNSTPKRLEQGLMRWKRLIDSERAMASADIRRPETESNHRIAFADLRQALALPQLDFLPTAK